MKFEKILVATDFGEASAQAIEDGIELAKTFGAALVLVHVYEIPALSYSVFPYPAVELLSTLEATARQQLDRTLADVESRFPNVTSSMRRGVVWREIIAAVHETEADLVVIGTHGRHGFEHALLGSVAEKVVRHSPVSVVTVHARPPATAGASAAE
jgi:nucleotide-binding universal stress UspA family protein